MAKIALNQSTLTKNEKRKWEMGNRNEERKIAMGNGERQRQLKNKSGQLKVESGKMGKCRNLSKRRTRILCISTSTSHAWSTIDEVLAHSGASERAGSGAAAFFFRRGQKTEKNREDKFLAKEWVGAK